MKKEKEKKRKTYIEQAFEFIEKLPNEREFTVHDVAKVLFPKVHPWIARTKTSMLMADIWRRWNKEHPENPLLRKRDKRYYKYFKTNNPKSLHEALCLKQQEATKSFLGARKKDLELAKNLNISIQDHLALAVEQAINGDDHQAIKLYIEILEVLEPLEQKALPALKQMIKKGLPKPIDTEKVGSVFMPRI